jgi:hypothetical protein
LKTEQLIETLRILDKQTQEFKKLCQFIIDQSLYWTGQDEEKLPGLKTIRTLAGYHLDKLS